MNNLIEQLKKNRYPWGIWTDDDCYGPELGVAMQEKAKEIPWKYFQVWGYAGDEDLWITPGSDTFRKGNAYRLRPDYADEPEIREMEISGNNSNCLCMYNDEGQNFGSIARVHERADFIGFKFKDGKLRQNSVAYFLKDTGLEVQSPLLVQIVSGAVIVKTACHVLSQRKKQE